MKISRIFYEGLNSNTHSPCMEVPHKQSIEELYLYYFGLYNAVFTVTAKATETG
jgi:hypothetical protein